MRAHVAVIAVVFAVLAQAGWAESPVPELPGSGSGEAEALPPGLHDDLMSGGATPNAPHAPTADPFADRHGHPHLQYCDADQCTAFCRRAETVSDPDLLSRQFPECLQVCMGDC